MRIMNGKMELIQISYISHLLLLSVLEKNIKEIPDEIFEKNGLKRGDVLFSATMGDGVYMDEMMETSRNMFNVKETLKAYELMKSSEILFVTCSVGFVLC